ncbi:hypothetical protein B0H12DRAFT_1154512, partial [Mycena haematopus]
MTASDSDSLSSSLSSSEGRYSGGTLYAQESRRALLNPKSHRLPAAIAQGTTSSLSSSSVIPVKLDAIESLRCKKLEAKESLRCSDGGSETGNSCFALFTALHRESESLKLKLRPVGKPQWASRPLPKEANPPKSLEPRRGSTFSDKWTSRSSVASAIRFKYAYSATSWSAAMGEVDLRIRTGRWQETRPTRG